MGGFGTIPLSSLSLLKDGNVGIFRDSTGSTEFKIFKSTAITRIKAEVEKEFWDQSLGNPQLIQRSFEVFIDWTRPVELRALVTERKHEHARRALKLLHENASDAAVFCRWEQTPRELRQQEQAIRPRKIDQSFMAFGKPDEARIRNLPGCETHGRILSLIKKITHLRVEKSLFYRSE